MSNRVKAVRTSNIELQIYLENVTIFVDIFLTVHFSIFILVINQLDAQNLFYNMFISCLYMFLAHVLQTCRGINKLIVKQILCIKLVNYYDKE